jgi:uncharacterized protein (TIGR02231 family)
MTLDVPVDPQYEMDGDVKTINSYGMMDDAEYMMKDNIQKLSSMNNTMNERDMLKYKVLSPTITKTLNIVSTEFTIEERYTILSEPKSIAVPVESIQAAATYQYFCAPRYDKDVFLTAQLVDWEQYNLLEGQANVFFEGTFIGNTYFDTRYLVDTLEVSLGRDKSIKVERVKARDYDKQLVVGSDQVAYRQWDISVRNTRQQPVNIVIQDQFPVSSDSKIDVTQEEMSGGEVDEKTGIVTWDLRLDPSVTQQLQLKYKVKYPKADYVGLE